MYEVTRLPEFALAHPKGSFGNNRCTNCGEYVFEHYLQMGDGKPRCIPRSALSAGLCRPDVDLDLPRAQPLHGAHGLYRLLPVGADRRPVRALVRPGHLSRRISWRGHLCVHRSEDPDVALRHLPARCRGPNDLHVLGEGGGRRNLPPAVPELNVRPDRGLQLRRRHHFRTARGRRRDPDRALSDLPLPLPDEELRRGGQFYRDLLVPLRRGRPPDDRGPRSSPDSRNRCRRCHRRHDRIPEHGEAPGQIHQGGVRRDPLGLCDPADPQTDRSPRIFPVAIGGVRAAQSRDFNFFSIHLCTMAR